jgi:hypothetical protein
MKSKDIEDMMGNIVIDWVGMQEWQARKTRGYKLFGKYFENLWD